jgi:hypothetical protein
MIASAADADASLVELEKIQQTTNVIEADARATRLLYQQNDAAFATVLEELVTRFDEQLEREKELILWHESAVKSNAKMHGHALCAVQESAKMLMSSRDKLEVVRAECQAASSSLSTQHALVVEQVTSSRERAVAVELQRQKELRPRPTVRQARVLRIWESHHVHLSLSLSLVSRNKFVNRFPIFWWWGGLFAERKWPHRIPNGLSMGMLM